MAKVELHISKSEIRKLTKKLTNLEQATKDMLRDNIDEAGINIESEAKSNIQMAGHIDTGRLWSSIHWESKTVNRQYSYTDNQGNQYSGSFKKDPKDLEIYAGTNVEYASFIEDLDAFLMPAWENERQKLIGRLKKGIG